METDQAQCLILQAGCRICKPHGGALPTKNPRRAWFLKVCHAPRLLVRSGSWIGWRELGGE